MRPADTAHISAARIREGDGIEFRRLYDTYGSRVLGFALRLTGSRPEAEDLVQEVFAAAYASRASFQGRSKPLTWLLGIATRRWRDCGRRATLPVSPLDEDIGTGCVATLEDTVIGTVTLSQALAKLDPAMRAALLLVASQGLTYKEAAEALGEPVGTVKWRVFEATRKMQKLLQAVEEEYDAMQQA